MGIFGLPFTKKYFFKIKHSVKRNHFWMNLSWKTILNLIFFNGQIFDFYLARASANQSRWCWSRDVTEVGEPLPKLAGLGLSPVRQIKPELKTGNKMRASAQLNRAHALLAICLYSHSCLDFTQRSNCISLIKFQVLLNRISNNFMQKLHNIISYLCHNRKRTIIYRV